MQLLKLLGKLATRLPRLKAKDWDSIFEFIDYFLIVQEEKPVNIQSIDWKKIREVIELLDKVED